MLNRPDAKAVVLVGFAEALSAPEVVWSLLDAGFHVEAFARRGKASALRHSRHVTCHEITRPDIDLAAALAELQTLMASLAEKFPGVSRVLFPLDDKAVWLASRVRFSDSWLLAGPTGPHAELALNKCLQIRAAQDAGFNVPASLIAAKAEEIFRFAETQGYPVILKPAECVPVRDGRFFECKKWTCFDRPELERAVAAWGESVPLLAQSFVSGVGEGVFGLATPEGIRAWSGHRRVRMMNPQGSGSSACVSQLVADDIRETAEHFIRNTGWSGLFMIELLRDDAGKAWFVELNGRPWGSMALCRRQGLEYPAWQVRRTLDPDSPAGIMATTQAGLSCRNAGREFMHLLFVLRGPRSKALTAWPSPGQTIVDLLRIRSRDTFYNWRGDDFVVFFGDFWCTIKDNVFKEKR